MVVPGSHWDSYLDLYLRARVPDELEGTDESDGPEGLGGISATDERGKVARVDRERKAGTGC